MGVISPYGKPIYYQQLVEVFGPPTFEDYTIGDLSIFASSLISSYQKSYHFPRLSDQIPLTYYADLAASVQLFLENCISSLISTSYQSSI